MHTVFYCCVNCACVFVLAGLLLPSALAPLNGSRSWFCMSATKTGGKELRYFASRKHSVVGGNFWTDCQVSSHMGGLLHLHSRSFGSVSAEPAWEEAGPDSPVGTPADICWSKMNIPEKMCWTPGTVCNGSIHSKWTRCSLQSLYVPRNRTIGVAWKPLKASSSKLRTY